MRFQAFRFGGVLSVCFVATLVTSAVPASAQATQQTSAPAAAPADLPSAKSIIDRHIEASGGRQTIQNRSSMQGVGTLAMPANGISGKIEIFAAKPNLLLVRTSVEGIGEMSEGFDGNIAWSMTPMTGPMLASEKEREQKRLDADFFGDLNVEKKYKAIKTVEKTVFGGKPSYKVSLTRHDGTEDFEYFDVETGLKSGRQVTRETPMGALTVTATMTEYKKFGGTLVPTTIKQNIMGMEQIITLSSVEYDKVDAAVFQLPPAIKALIK